MSVIRISTISKFFVVLITLGAVPASAAEGDSTPFSARNLNPFILIYGIPPATSAALLPPDTSSVQVHLDIANHSKTATSASESIQLDGETYRTSFVWQRGLGDGWQVGVELPLISHSSGAMDQPWIDQRGSGAGAKKPIAFQLFPSRRGGARTDR